MLNRKKSIHLSVRFSDAKLDKGYSLKYEQRSRHRSIRESTQKNLEKFGGMKQRVLSLRPETCERQQDGRKKKC